MYEDIMELLGKNPINTVKLHEIIGNMNTVDVADAFEEMSKEQTIQVFRLLPKNLAAEVFSYLIPEKQQIIVEALTDVETGLIIEELYLDDAVDFIEEMPANVVKHVLMSVSEDTRKQINQILQYPEDSVGSIMTTEYVDLKENVTVNDAFVDIRKTGVDKETIYTCFVISKERLLVGVVSAKTLLLSNPDDRIGELMDENFICAHTTDDREEAADLFRRYGLLSMPVVDKENRLVGIVTVDDIVQVIEEENTEDFEKMAALAPSDEPYLKTKVFKLARNRIPWLLILMLSAMITESIITGFEEAFKVLPSLVAFIPMLMNTGGNSGAQASTLIIRGIALGEIQLKDILIIIWREIRIGVICGLTLGAVNFVRVFVTNEQDVLLSATTTASLIITVILAKTVGCTLPLLAKKLKIDPAIMATPMITTIVDACSLAVYFMIANLILIPYR